MFVIEDQVHAEWQGKYNSLPEAVATLKHMASIPWHQEPNRCPCESWKTCGREYEIIEYNTVNDPWAEVQRLGTLEVSSKGVAWRGDLKNV